MTKIKAVEAMSVAYPEPNDGGSTRYLTLCRIEAKDGTTGWGESVPMSGSGFPEACKATEEVIRGLAALVIGREPTENRSLWHEIKARTWWYGPEGIAAFALSAIDMALWDLRGKESGQSLTSMLGGTVRASIPASAATIATLTDLGAEAERHGAIARAGFPGVKVAFTRRSGLGLDFDRDVEFMRLLREAVGPKTALMIDRSHDLPWTPTDAIRVTRAMEEHGLFWIEEPLEPHEIDGFKRLRNHVSALIATGERQWNMRGYRELIQSGVVDVVGCDPGRAEGVTGFVQLVREVEAAGVWFNAHSWSSAINTAASLAVSASSERCLFFELKPDENPMQHELVEEPFYQKDGVVIPPVGPGLGVTVREDVVKRYRL